MTSRARRGDPFRDRTGAGGDKIEMREFRPSVKMQIGPFLEDVAVAGVLLAIASWRGEPGFGLILAACFIIRTPLSFLMRYGLKRPLYVIEGDRLKAGPFAVDFSHREHILSVDRNDQHKMAILLDNAIPMVIDLQPLCKMDRDHLANFVSERTRTP